MPKRPDTSEQQPLAALLARLETMPAVAATRGLLSAAFLFTNLPDRPFSAHGFNVTQTDVLAAIARTEGMGLRCSQIAERTLITKGGISKILDRLEARGLLKRVPSHDDRRSVWVQLSAKGVEFCRAFFPELARNDREIFAKAFRPGQLKQFNKLLTLLVRTLEAESESQKTQSIAAEVNHGA